MLKILQYQCFLISKSYIFFTIVFAVILTGLVSCGHYQQNLSSESSLTTRSKKAYFKGLTLFKKKKLDSSRAYFENINKGSKYFVPAILETQKINYIQGKWDQFFGAANYYRLALLANDAAARRYFQQEILALEVLALIRHCRFDLAYQVVEYSLALGRRIHKNTLKIQQAGYFFKLKKLSVSKKTKKQNIKFIRRMNFWLLQPNQLKELDNPKNLRMQVKSKC